MIDPELSKGFGLVVSRERDQRIYLGTPPHTVITVVDIRGQRVRIGIKTLDRNMPINRQECYEAMERNGETRG